MNTTKEQRAKLARLYNAAAMKTRLHDSTNPIDVFLDAAFEMVPNLISNSDRLEEVEAGFARLHEGLGNSMNAFADVQAERDTLHRLLDVAVDKYMEILISGTRDEMVLRIVSEALTTIRAELEKAND